MNQDKMPYVHRDISWLTFNYRVLQEAKDPSVPLLERLKFLAIYSNNLDEYFRVRVASNRSLLRLKKKDLKNMGMTVETVLDEIHKTVNKQQEEFSKIFSKNILAELSSHGIDILKRNELNEEQQEFIENYFRDNMLPYVQPVLLVKNKILPFLNDAALYLAINMEDREEHKTRYAILQIPSAPLGRFVELPTNNGKQELIMLDDIVRHSIAFLFPGYDIRDTHSIKLTRDAELYIDDEYSGDLIAKIKKSITKRNVGPATRFVYDRTMPKKMLEFLMGVFSLKQGDLLPEGRYHNNFDFFNFPDFDLKKLKEKPIKALTKISMENGASIFENIAREDHLLLYPYHDYEHTIRFFEEAAQDPDVTHIKITQYRVARKSRIMNALINASKAGKQVTAFVEVKARFDEEANLEWAEKLEKAGVKVLYSFPGLKVHCKLAMVNRIENTEHKTYCYMSTGNFHEGTVKVYTDYGFFTADSHLTNEVIRIFNFLETVKAPLQPFKHLMVGQFNLRSKLNHLIDKEIQNAKAGKKAKIILKINSIEDRDVIEKLYKASNAGVKIQIICRGLCCLVPGIKGYSENISVISIVDRFLEHTRVYYFHNQGEEQIYLSSADIMTRNLSYRIEAAFPIYDKTLKKEVRDYLRIQLLDNTKARIIDGKKNDEYKVDKSDLKIRSQMEMYYYFKRREELAMQEEQEKEEYRISNKE